MSRRPGENVRMKYILLIGIAVFVLLHIVPAPHRLTRPAVDRSRSIAADPDVPQPVMRIIKRSCMDCHSHETRVPWYGHVAPVSWLLAKDVNGARKAMNLSEWGASAPAVHFALSAAACEGVKSGRMPLPHYLYMHPEARLSPDDVQVLCGWQKAAMAAMIRKRNAK
jgi:hypothetical protein